MDATKTKSYRLTEEIHEKINEIANEIGGSQQQTISKLIEAYELQKGKVVLADKKADIETFENYVTSLTRMYMTTLEENQNTKELVRTEFEAQLISKDNVIQDLQKQLSSSKETERQAIANTNALQTENQKLNDYINTLKKEYESKIKNLESMLSDKQELNKRLTETVEQQKLQITEIGEKVSEVEILKANTIKYQNKLQDTEKAMEQQQLQHKNEILDLREKLQNEKAEEVQKYQNLYFEKAEEAQKYQKLYLDMMQEKKPKGTKGTRSKKESSANATANHENKSENEQPIT